MNVSELNVLKSASYCRCISPSLWVVSYLTRFYGRYHLHPNVNDNVSCFFDTVLYIEKIPPKAGGL